MVRSAKSAKRTQAEERQKILLGRLKEVAEQLDLEVREEKLHRDLGYRVRSGLCLIDGREVLLLDRNVSLEERVDLLSDALATKDLDSIYLEPEIRQLITGGGGDGD